MVRRPSAAANESRAARGQPKLASFGFRDVKGKGATDMWLVGVPIEQIQVLIGHKNKAMSKIYSTQR